MYMMCVLSVFTVYNLVKKNILFTRFTTEQDDLTLWLPVFVIKV